MTPATTNRTSAVRRNGRWARDVCSDRRTVATCTSSRIVAPHETGSDTASTYVTTIITKTSP